MLKFTKMQGLGNDYVYLDCTKVAEPKDISTLVHFVSNRHFSVSFDGLVLICVSKTCDFKNENV